MADKIQQNQFDEQGVNPFNAPIPGESLTASPDTPTPWTCLLYTSDAADE